MPFLHNPRPFKNRLSYQVAFLVIVCAGVLTLVSALVHLYITYRGELADVHDTMAFIGQSYQPSLAYSLYRVDEEQVELQLRGILKLKHIALAEVNDSSDGRTYSISQGKPGEKYGLMKNFPLTFQRADGKTADLGQLKVGVNLGEIHKGLWKDFAWILLQTAVQMFFLTVLILLIIHFLVTRHLMKMAGHTENIDFEKQLKPLALQGFRSRSFKNEIDEVAAAVNDFQMRIKEHIGQLVSSEAALAKARDELEQRVKDRTRELEDSNSQLKAEIEERRRAESALLESREKFQSLFHLNPAGVAVTSIDENRFVEVNDAFARMVGFSREELIGKPIQELGFWADPQEVARLTLLAIEEGGFKEMETVCLDKEGHKLSLLWSAAVKRLDGEQLCINVFIDMTESKRLREDRKELEAHLRQAQKMEAIGTLAGGIAHDFNNILSAVIGYSEIMKMDIPEGSKLHADVEEVLKAGNRAKELIRHILTFSRQRASEPVPFEP